MAARRMNERTEANATCPTKGQRANGDADDKRADDARAAVKGRHAGGQADTNGTA